MKAQRVTFLLFIPHLHTAVSAQNHLRGLHGFANTEADFQALYDILVHVSAMGLV